MVLPEAGRRRGGDCDAALLLLRHPVHRGSAFVDFADLVGAPGVVENPLSRSRLAGIDMRHDADVPIPLEGCRACHGRSSDGIARGGYLEGKPELAVLCAVYQR